MSLASMLRPRIQRGRRDPLAGRGGGGPIRLAMSKFRPCTLYSNSDSDRGAFDDSGRERAEFDITRGALIRP